MDQSWTVSAEPSGSSEAVHAVLLVPHPVEVPANRASRTIGSGDSCPGQIKNTGATGSFELLLDVTQMPTPTGFVAAAAGQTWNLTTRHRDAVGGVAVSNFTNGLPLDLQ